MTTPKKLSPNQINHFRTHGYLPYSTIFSAKEINALQQAYMDCLNRLHHENQLKNIRPGTRDDGAVSCWMAFDDATVDNGCMWVLPNHHHKLWDHSRIKSGGYTMTDPDESQAIPIELKAGQIMFHHGATPHRTLPNTTENHRRALAIHYMDATARPLGGNRESEPPENMPVVRGTTS